MLTITDTAAARLTQLLNERGSVAHDTVVRIVRRQGRLKFLIDQPQADDTTFTVGGRTVLVYDRVIAGSLAQRTLDVQQTATGPRLSLNAS